MTSKTIFLVKWQKQGAQTLLMGRFVVEIPSTIEVVTFKTLLAARTF